ncbi:hypothetical protein DID73_01320 [Candidatus Marinamargulisbacteria bacterium SCGC AG-343-K17]|nr:hypothetical protein DID73_01320 [Candidatus Marinamargulisbacteria bacterium SCGC AG-343-K17]
MAVGGAKGGAKSSFNYQVKNQTLGELRGKFKSGGLTKIFPNLRQDVLNIAIKSNDQIMTLLTAETSDLAEMGEVDNKAVKTDMSQMISITINESANNEFESVIKILDDIKPDTGSPLTQKSDAELHKSAEFRQKQKEQLSSQIESLNEQVESLKTEKESILSELKQYSDESDQVLNDLANKKLELRHDDQPTLGSLEKQLAGFKEQASDVEKTLSSIENELKLRDEEAVSIDLGENPQDSGETKAASTDGKGEIEQTAFKDNNSKLDAAFNNIKGKWDTGFTIKQGNETLGVKMDNLMNYVGDEIGPEDAKKMLQSDINKLDELSNPQGGDDELEYEVSELRQQLKDKFDEIDNTWI